MIGRRAVIGLSLLSALLVCAFAAQSASAIERTKSKNTTAFTCVPDPTNTGDFKDAHCDETNIGKGAFDHEPIPLDTTTSIDGTNKNVTNGTKDHEPAVLRGTLFGAKSEISCTTVKNNTEKSWIENTEPEKGKHTIKGTIVTEFKDCTVLKPAKCAVSEAIISEAEVHGVEGMIGPTKDKDGNPIEKNAMGLEFVGHGPENTFAKITFKNKGEEKCSLNEKTFSVQGNVVATSGPTTESDQENKESGATLVFTPKFNMQTLKFGGVAAEFETIATATMAGGGNPISLTTTP